METVKEVPVGMNFIHTREGNPHKFPIHLNEKVHTSVNQNTISEIMENSLEKSLNMYCSLNSSSCGNIYIYSESTENNLTQFCLVVFKYRISLSRSELVLWKVIRFFSF